MCSAVVLLLTLTLFLFLQVITNDDDETGVSFVDGSVELNQCYAHRIDHVARCDAFSSSSLQLMQLIDSLDGSGNLRKLGSLYCNLFAARKSSRMTAHLDSSNVATSIEKQTHSSYLESSRKTTRDVAPSIKSSIVKMMRYTSKHMMTEVFATFILPKHHMNVIAGKFWSENSPTLAADHILNLVTLGACSCNIPLSCFFLLLLRLLPSPAYGQAEKVLWQDSFNDTSLPLWNTSLLFSAPRYCNWTASLNGAYLTTACNSSTVNLDVVLATVTANLTGPFPFISFRTTEGGASFVMWRGWYGSAVTAFPAEGDWHLQIIARWPLTLSMEPNQDLGGGFYFLQQNQTLWPLASFPVPRTGWITYLDVQPIVRWKASVSGGTSNGTRCLEFLTFFNCSPADQDWHTLGVYFSSSTSTFTVLLDNVTRIAGMFSTARFDTLVIGASDLSGGDYWPDLDVASISVSVPYVTAAPPNTATPTTIGTATTAPTILRVNQTQPLIIVGNFNIPTTIVLANSTVNAAIIVSGVANIINSSSLIVQLIAPLLPNSSVAPILQAASIQGQYSSVVIQDASGRHCDVAGQLQQSETSISVLLIVNNCRDSGRIATWKVALIVILVVFAIVAGVGIAAWFGRRGIINWRERTRAGIYDRDEIPSLVNNSNSLYTNPRKSWTADLYHPLE